MIRKAVSFDSERLTELAKCSKSFWGYSPEFISICNDELTHTSEQIKSDKLTYFVHLSGQHISGFYVLEKLSSTDYELDSLFIDPEFIRCGIGKQLFDHAKNEAKNFGANQLYIYSDPYADEFYISQGAIVIGKLESNSIQGRFLSRFKVEFR